MKQAEKQQGFVRGAMLLSLAVAFVKVVGMLYKIPLTAMLTGQGMGYYNTAYNIFNIFYSLATAGMPIAVARLVAENLANGRFRDARKVFRVSSLFFCITGLGGFLLTFFGAGAFAGLMNNTNARLSIAAIAPAILFGCLMSSYRGYYQGLNNMKPTACSEMAEALIRLLCGLGFAFLVFRTAGQQFAESGTVFGQAAENQAEATKLAMPAAAAASILGVSLSTVGGFLFLFLRHKIKGDGIAPAALRNAPKPRSSRSLLRQLLVLAVPVCLGTMMANITALIDNLSIINRLIHILDTAPQTLIALCDPAVLAEKGILLPAELSALSLPVKQEIANYLYGSYGYLNSLFTLLPAITTAFGIGILPTITACHAKADRTGVRQNTGVLLRLCSLISMPCGIGLCLLSGPVLTLLYGNKPEVALAAPALSVAALGALFLSLSSPIYSVMQGLGRADLPVYIMAAGGALKLLTNLLLVGIPEINIYGAAAGTLLCYLLIFFVARFALCRLTGQKQDWNGTVFKPLLAALLCGFAAVGVRILLSRFLHSRLLVLPAVLVGGLVYLFTLGFLKGLKKSDILTLPKGEKIAKLLAKIHCLG